MFINVRTYTITEGIAHRSWGRYSSWKSRLEIVSSRLLICLFAFFCCYFSNLFLTLPECSNYQVLSENDRNTAYKGSVKCDNSMATRWYRFQGGAGSQMPTKCVPINQCGTHAPGWLSAGHPTVNEGAVQRKVCFHWSSNCCRWSSNIRVRNCGGFFVYELVRPPACSLRYCGEKGQGKSVFAYLLTAISLQRD